MAETIPEDIIDPPDLEDGEIESDGESLQNDVDSNNKPDELSNPTEESKVEEKTEAEEIYYSNSGKKKKSKNKEQKSKDKNKKYNKYLNSTEDDFAGSIEKAIRKVLNKNDDGILDNQDDVDDRRKRKKRKRYDGKDYAGKKRRKQDYIDEVDESEMMCIRGASPVPTIPPTVDNYQDDNQDSYDSEDSNDSRNRQSRSQRQKSKQRERKNKNDRDRRRNTHPMQDTDGVCLYYMQGKCHKGDDCIFSHDAQPPRKMELCKFYLMDCCAKRDKCLYMHSDFPCKFYHTGLPCVYKDDCKFAHGKALSENLKMILLKHIDLAPKEILGDFPRLNREGAAHLINKTQSKLLQQFSSEGNDSHDKSIPSLFELNIPKPHNISEHSALLSIQGNDKSHKVSSKIRQSRWQNDNSPLVPVNILSIKNLNGVLTPKQISDLTKMGIDNLDHLGQLTVLQLNSIGISFKQITDIQLNTMNIQKLGLINTNPESQTTSPTFISSMGSSQDLDLRIPPEAPVAPVAASVATDLAGKDVDMRFQHSRSILPTEDDSVDNKVPQHFKESSGSKDMIDIDQYTKDALKFAAKDKENIDNSNDTIDNDKSYSISKTVSVATKDIDHRVLKFTDDCPSNFSKSEKNCEQKGADTDIRFLQPGPLFKNMDKRNRRSTTDDEDNNLLIDEKWYSSDEEKNVKRKSLSSSPIPLSPPAVVPIQQSIEPAAVLSKLGDLSKIAISDEVTKLLNTMKNNLQDSKPVEKTHNNDNKSRDPRSFQKKSPEHKNELYKLTNKKTRISIYECIEGEPTDGRRRSDVDLRQNEMPLFGDSDLRPNSSGDIDFRLGLPFKPIPNYTPASEIDGSINSHPPMLYRLMIIDIPRPDYTDIRNSTAKSQAMLDPRLRKVFRLSIDDSNSDSEKPAKPCTAPRIDPRRKQKEVSEIQEQRPPSLDLQSVLQNSDWYKELSSNQKIFVNQNLASVTAMIKRHQQDKLTGIKFDLMPIQSNPVLCNIFSNLNVSLNENCELTYLPKPKEALLKTPVNYNQSFGISGANLDTNNVNVMNMPHMNMSGGGMNNINMSHMSPYNSFPDPRMGPTPGLLGVAPNIPHQFDNNFAGPNNFGNMPFNGPGNDYGNMDTDQGYKRFPKRGGFRGRGNDRWNRGGPARGHRDRKNFNDRGGWNNDRN